MTLTGLLALLHLVVKALLHLIVETIVDMDSYFSFPQLSPKFHLLGYPHNNHQWPLAVKNQGRRR